MVKKQKKNKIKYNTSKTCQKLTDYMEEEDANTRETEREE
jgi:hypothetical protein